MRTRARTESWVPLACVGASRYEVSNRAEGTYGVRNARTGLVLRAKVSGTSPYPEVSLVCDDGRLRTFTVHGLVMAAHAPGPRPVGRDGRPFEILHGPRGPLRAWFPEDLRYGTAAENLRDRWGRWHRWSRTVRAARRAWAGSR
jgi:hypothetical protein